MSAQNQNDQNGSLADKQREVRLGLVMYGGVSLAIYINGVAREFFRAVRGNGVYKLVKALTDSDIIVDVISGTSAGGINGIMLAYALCNGKDFASCANLWRIDGDVRSLLRSPDKESEHTESLFDSEGYYQPRLEAAFRDMPDYVAEEGEIESKFPELDLFVTGTDVGGNIFTQFDDAGHPIDVKDHRSVFQLKHRAGRKEPFNPDSAGEVASIPENTFRALAKLSRITSCFPAAFTPVRVTNEDPGGETVDGKLQQWGDLGKDTCFLDGGIIDNKPFTYTIKEIFYRVADRQVERKLFYVEPDPEHFSRMETAAQPNFVQAIIASLIGIPGYESISDDLKLLAKHNSKIKQYQRLRSRLEAHLAGAPDSAREPSQSEKLLYEQCGLIALSERVIEGILKVDGRSELLGNDARLAASALIESFDAVETEMKSVTSAQDEAQPQDGAPAAKKRSRVPSTLRNFDVSYRLRRLFRTVYKIEETIRMRYAEGAKTGEINKYANLWRLLNREIELLDIVNVNMERLIDEAPIGWKEEIGGALRENDQARVTREAKLIWGVVSAALQELIGADEEAAKLLPPAFESLYAELNGADHETTVIRGFEDRMLSDFNRALKEKIEGKEKNGGMSAQHVAELKKGVAAKTAEERAQESRAFKGIFQLTKEFERNVIDRVLKDQNDAHEQGVRNAYYDFERVDAQLFPLEFVAELNEKDIIETIRISPRDAEKGFSNKGLSDKVSGDALYHFGGFFKRSWRSNDILWGRLDSLCQLVETLFNPERIRQVLGNRLQFERVRGRFFKNAPDGESQHEWVPAMRPERLFPNAGRATQHELEEWLVALLWHAEPPAGDALEPLLGGKAFAGKIERVVEAAQLEVLHEDLPSVITDALEEQARWNQFRFPRAQRKLRLPGLPASLGGAGGGGNGKPKGAQADAVMAKLEELNPFVYKPSDANLDPFVSVLAAAGAAHDVMRRFEQSPVNSNPETPMKTDLGTFFTNAYKIGSEALLRDMPPLVLLEILSVSLLVLRNCVLKAFGPNAARIKSHPLYVCMVDFPLRAFNTLVLFLRRVPSSRKWLPISLFFLSALLLFIGVVWHDSIIWTAQTYDVKGNTIEGQFHLRWFVVFIAAPLVVLFAQGVYLYQGKVNDWTWLRGARDLGLGFLLLFPMLIVILAYTRLYGAAKESLIAWGSPEVVAEYSVAAAIGLTLLGPLLALALLSRLSQKRRNNPGRLRELLQKYFSLQEMLVIARRLDLFSQSEVDALAREIGYFSQADLADISQRISLRLAWHRASDAGKEGTRYEAEEKEVSYAEVYEKFGEIEKELKREAYDALRGKVRSMERARVGAEVEQLAAAPVEADLRAVDEFYERIKKIEEEKVSMAVAAIENAKRTKRAEAAGIILAERMIDKAEERDGRDKPKDEREKTVTRLEDLMYSINPEALR